MSSATTSTTTSITRLWWQDGVIYQVYPRSFQDSNGDGVGDLAGVLSRLDYLVTLGISAIWLSPFYPSPMADFGYDVADYCNVDPLFGTLEDFDRLIAGIHERGLKLIVDFVPNHTSDQHPWFLESRASRQSAKRDWYLWRDPAPNGGPPNNWTGNFGGSGWTLDAATGQYYYHSFLTQQPDLNWRNSAVREAIYTAMRFWLQRGAGGHGVDGFRMDVLWLLIKDDQFRDNPPNPNWTPGGSTAWSVLPVYTADRPETRQIVAEMRTVMSDCGDCVLIGEIYLPLRDLVAYYGFDPNTALLRGADMPFNFHLIQTEWSADRIAALIREYESELPAGAWPNWVMGNHDQARIATRLGDDQARIAAMLLLTLRGTPTLYYGDELGMTNGSIPPDMVQDPAEKNQPGIGMGRDPERTPMLWDPSPNAGFTTGKPWLPIGPDSAWKNVVAQTTAPRSILALYRRLLELRLVHPALHAGIVDNVTANNGVLSYLRSQGDQRIEVFLNLTANLRQVNCSEGHILATTILDGDGGHVNGDLVLEANEGIMILLINP